jgi:MoaA/NifB/PqqE/SkfB family radical SAM enzyme
MITFFAVTHPNPPLKIRGGEVELRESFLLFMNSLGTKLRSHVGRLKRKKRPFIAFQIEPTSRCQLRCVMCPRTVFSKEWDNGDMPLSLFDKVSSHFHLVENIHLQGWGEPLLHPEINRMIQIAKTAGCNTSLTTNGVLLDERMSEEFIKLGLGTIAISITGATRETHEAIRCGSHFEQIIKSAKTLVSLKANMRSETPKIVFSYLMTKRNIEELSEAVVLAKDSGADELLATNVDYAPGQIQDEMRVFACKEAEAEYNKIIEKTFRTAKESKITLRVYPLAMEELLMCEMNPLKIIFISHDGCVSPCVYVNLPKKGSIPRIFCSDYYEIQRQCFGNVEKDDFVKIWEQKEYDNFRGSYIRRIAFNKSAFDVIGNMQSSEHAMVGLEKLEAALRENPLPTICRTCYKAYNI